MDNNKKSNGVIVGLLLGITIMLVVLVVLFATNTISFTSKATTNESGTTNTEDNSTIKELTKEEAEQILNDRIEKIFKYVHSLSAYCGETEASYPEDTNNYDKEKYIVEGFITYFASKYSNKEELTNYMKTFMNDEVIKKYSREGVYTSDTYKEQNGKLFCLNTNKDCGMIYDSDKSTFTITNQTNDIINATGKLSHHSCDDREEYLTISIDITKDSNGNWIITKYEEQ